MHTRPAHVIPQCRAIECALFVHRVPTSVCSFCTERAFVGPAALQTLLLAASPEPKIDNRVADRAQAQPAEGGSHSLTLAATERVDLQQLFWSLAVLLFAAERALSFRSPPSAAARKSARVREENPVLV